MFTLEKVGSTCFLINGGNKTGKIISVTSDPNVVTGHENIRTEKYKLEQIPNFVWEDGKAVPQRENIYLPATSGSGKTYWCATYIRNFKKLFPDAKVFVFSRLDSDEVLDCLDINRITLDEDL